MTFSAIPLMVSNHPPMRQKVKATVRSIFDWTTESETNPSAWPVKSKGAWSAQTRASRVLAQRRAFGAAGCSIMADASVQLTPLLDRC